MDVCNCDEGKCVECKEYEKSIKEICEIASAFLKARDKTDDQKPGLVVLDIDGTALDDRRKGRKNEGLMSRHDPVHLFYEGAIGLGYEVVFLTARMSYNNHAQKNLTTEGYGAHEIIYSPTSVERDMSALALWKDYAREELEKKYTLVVCMGDQPMDVCGKHIGEQQYLLPEPPKHQQACAIQ